MNLCDRLEVVPDTAASFLGGLSLQSCFGVSDDEIGQDSLLINEKT